jgi:ABC-type multidrug transport system fused ATPase/permease subunit
MFYVAPDAAMVAVGGLLLFGAALFEFNKLNNRFAAHLRRLQLAYERSKVRAARNWLLLRALRLGRLEYWKQIDAFAAHYRYSVLSYLMGNLGTALAPVFSVLMLALVVLVHSVLLGRPAADLIAFLYLLFRFQQMLSSGSNVVGGLFTHGNHVREAGRFLAEFSAEDLERALAPDSNLRFLRSPNLRRPVDRGSEGSAAETPPAAPALVVSELAFAWPGHDQSVFRHVNVELAPGEQLGVVGANGTGKSTFLAILLGPLRAQHGKVLLNGGDSAIWVAQHSSSVGFVGVDPYLVEGSIGTNLEYGLDGTASEAQLWGVLEEVSLADRVRTLPQGLDHPITESGEGLSAGEKQKLAIARALLRRPSLLVLDEPTPHVDESSERDIVETLHRLHGRCTVVLVSHKTAALQYADRLLRFESVERRSSVADG